VAVGRGGCAGGGGGGLVAGCANVWGKYVRTKTVAENTKLSKRVIAAMDMIVLMPDVPDP
jgi:DNA replicative helicase MCM subunit Mcm2 (Cdc46/Mcm family)